MPPSPRERATRPVESLSLVDTARTLATRKSAAFYGLKTTAMSGEYAYEVDDKVLCFHGALLYEAKVGRGRVAPWVLPTLTQ